MVVVVKYYFIGSVCIFCFYEEIFLDFFFIVENGFSFMKFVV